MTLLMSDTIIAVTVIIRILVVVRDLDVWICGNCSQTHYKISFFTLFKISIFEKCRLFKMSKLESCNVSGNSFRISKNHDMGKNRKSGKSRFYEKLTNLYYIAAVMELGGGGGSLSIYVYQDLSN